MSVGHSRSRRASRTRGSLAFRLPRSRSEIRASRSWWSTTGWPGSFPRRLCRPRSRASTGTETPGSVAGAVFGSWPGIPRSLPRCSPLAYGWATSRWAASRRRSGAWQGRSFGRPGSFSWGSRSRSSALPMISPSFVAPRVSSRFASASRPCPLRARAGNRCRDPERVPPRRRDAQRLPPAHLGAGLRSPAAPHAVARARLDGAGGGRRRGSHRGPPLIRFYNTELVQARASGASVQPQFGPEMAPRYRVPRQYFRIQSEYVPSYRWVRIPIIRFHPP